MLTRARVDTLSHVNRALVNVLVCKLWCVNQVDEVMVMKLWIFAGYKVIINLHEQRTGHVLDSRTTGTQTTSSPCWNEAFLFGLDSDTMDDYYLEFIVMEKRRMAPRSTVIGKAWLSDYHS